MRRYALLFLLCILLGIATTVGIAWSLAAWSNYPTGKVEDFYDSSNNPNIKILAIRGFGSENLFLCQSHFELNDYRYNTLSINRNWSILRHVGPESGYDREVAHGWPFLAVSSRWLDVESGPSQLESGYKIKNEEHVDFVMPYPGQGNIKTSTTLSRVLPYSIYWQGFILDTLIYAIFWLFIFLSISRMKDKFRIKHGHCPACNYDLRYNVEAGCPECGWNRNPLIPDFGRG